MTADFAWLTHNSLEIYEKYAGKWIAVCNCEVAGLGDSATEAAAQAESRYPNASYLFEYVDPNPDRI